MIGLLAAARATLRVIGLATVMQGNPGIDVVMPQVNPAQTSVEPHIPVLIVRSNELIGPTDDWTIVTYDEGFIYLDLTGEDVQFLPDTPNPLAGVPVKLPGLTNGCRSLIAPDRAVRAAGGASPALHAGHPIDDTPRQPSLSDGYGPPLYKVAAAVLRVPYGTTSACGAVVKNELRTRIDTRVAWAAGGGVTIVGKHHKRRLRLKGDDVLIVAGNVPTSMVLPAESSPEESHPTDMGHFSVYYTMLGIMERHGCEPNFDHQDIPACPESTIKAVHVGANGFPPTHLPIPKLMFIVTSECSNSQYP